MAKAIKIFALVDGDPTRKVPRLFPTREAAQGAREADMEAFWADYDEHYVCPWIDWGNIADIDNPPTPVKEALDEWVLMLKEDYGDPLPEIPPYPGFAAALERFPDCVEIVEIDFEPAPALTVIMGGRD